MGIHKCSDVCELTKSYYPEQYMRCHGFSASLVRKIEPTAKHGITLKVMQGIAKKIKIKCRRSLTNEELAAAIEARQSGNELEVKKLEQIGRDRYQLNFKNWKTKLEVKNGKY